MRSNMMMGERVKHVNNKQEQRVKKNRFELQCGNANIRQIKQSSEVQCVHTRLMISIPVKETTPKKRRVVHFESNTHTNTDTHKTIV